jgi:FAD/FMN-containing dehydrogenase
LARLSKQLSSPLLLPASGAFGSAARLYNPRFDRSARPAAVAQCHSAADVAACISYASSAGSPIALRAGGHSYGGWSSGTGLVADVRAMSAASVDTAAGMAKIGAGAKLVDVYAALAAHGVALAGGSCPTVGLTGLSLGGGVGVLSRAFGLTCDALRAATVVTADGQIRTVDSSHDPDLFWALCGGGGGSFGAVTDLTFAVRPAPAVHTFFLEWDFAHAAAVLAGWQGWIAKADKQLWSTCKLLADPGKDGLHVTVSGTWIGAASSLQSVLAPLLAAVGAPTTANQQNSLDYASAMLLEAGCYGQSPAQCAAAALGPVQRQPFAATSAILDSPLPSGGISAAVARAAAGMSVPGLVEGGMSFDSLGGAVSAVAPSATAFVHRTALASIQYTATWSPASGSAAVADPAPFDSYVRASRAALLPWTGAAAYANYADPVISDYGHAYWGANYARLQSIKKQYDPGNLFTFAQSVKA